MTKPQILVGRFVEFFESIGVDTEVAEAFNADYQVTLGDFVVFEDNAVEILKEEKEKLNDKGARAYRLIAVTNGTKIAQEKKLKTSGLNEIFDTVYISEDVGIEKPNKGYFDAVIKGEGITDLKETVIIGDSLTSDILGGNNASIDTIWYNPYGKVNDKGVKVTYEIENLSYLREII